MIFALSLFLLTSATYGQDLKKGTLVGVHTFDGVKLAPGVTIEQYVSAFNKLIPTFEKAQNGWRFYPIKRIRGDKSATYGVMIVIPSMKERDKYYNADGSENELGKSVDKTLEPEMKELNKLGTMSTDRYIDWLVY